MFGLVAFPFFLFIEKGFHVITQLGVWCHWWFNYPGPLLEVELESACFSGQGCGLCIALIRPNHWAASVAQWLEHLSSKQCVWVRIPPEQLFFLFRENNYPGPLLEVELESACLSGQGCGLCIALIRPNHWAASVAQWLEHLSSKQCVVGSNPTRKELFGLVAFPFFLFIEKSFHVITQLGVWCHWWFNYPGPLLEVELESVCLSGQGCGLCIALIPPNHWAASVAQWLEHLSSKQCRGFESHPKRVVWVSCLSLFSIYRKEFSCDYSTWSVVSLVV